MSKSKSTQSAISDLRHRILIQKLVLTSDGMGGKTQLWVDLIPRAEGADIDDSKVWASVVPVSSSERRFAERVEYQRSHKITMRYRGDVTTTMRFIFNDEIYQFKGNLRPDSRRFYLFLDAEINRGT